MDPTAVVTKTTDTLLNSGVLGTLAVVLLLLLAVAGWAIRRLYNDNQTVHTAFSAKLAEATVAFNASTTAVQDTKSTLVAINSTLDTLGKSVSALAHEAAKNDSEIRHGLNNTSAGLTAVVGVIDKIREDSHRRGGQ